MDAFKKETSDLCNTYSKEQLAEQLVMARNVMKTYREVNEELRKEIESLCHLISRQRAKLEKNN